MRFIRPNTGGSLAYRIKLSRRLGESWPGSIIAGMISAPPPDNDVSDLLESLRELAEYLAALRAVVDAMTDESE